MLRFRSPGRRTRRATVFRAVAVCSGGRSITSARNATYAPASGSLTARHVSCNAALAPGAPVTIGFPADHAGNTAAPTAFTLDGAACTAA